jgi:hypothetical protein
MSLPTRRGTNYVNNKDLLREIHLSKKSYCSFLNSKQHADYDIIVGGIDEITADTLSEGIAARATRLAKEAFDAMSAVRKCRLSEFAIPLSDINPSDVVFRVMTWDHIPIDEVKQRKANAKAQEEWDRENSDEGCDDDEPVVAIQAPSKYVKTNFPPFQHYVVSDAESLTPILVGKSHWKGGLEDGHFCKDHGRITNNLAKMYVELCKRYGLRYNWRAYTYNQEMQGQALLQLTLVGLQFNEAKGKNPFAYFTRVMQNSFTRVLNMEKGNQNLRDDILEMNGLTPSYTRQGQWASTSTGHDE